MLEELRDAKSIENDIKILVGKKIALEDENKKLRQDLDSKFLQANDRVYEQNDLALNYKTLQDQHALLNKTFSELRENSFATTRKLEAEKAKLAAELVAAKTFLEVANKEVFKAQSRATEVTEKLTNVDGQAKNMLDARE